MKLNIWKHQMVRRARKLVVSPLRAVVLGGTALILLSVPAVESGRCYWCGPLAEQVHRSRRAPPCGAPGDHTTTCEPDLGHCAVVATAPPYVESRYCVKLYQDECYSLFCNTTKTWRMTCPCRGDLCNGPNTDRETEAFNVLKTLVDKTRLKKRATIFLGKVMDSDNENSDITNNMISSTTIWNESSQNNIENNSNADQETKSTEISEMQSSINASIVSKDENTDDKQNNETESNPDNPEVNSDNNEMQSDAPVEDPKNENGNDKIEQTENSNPYNDITTSTKSPNTESVLSTVKTTAEKHEETETPTNQPNSPTKPTGVLPTAEALQQNENPTADIEKTPNQSTTGKTPSISTLPNIEVTLVPSIPGKNACNSISMSLILLIYCITVSM